MTEFITKYSELGFYVDGSLRKFRSGRYSTEDKAEIDVLRKLTDVAEVKAEKSAPKAEDKEPAEKSKPAAKAKADAKPSGK